MTRKRKIFLPQTANSQPTIMVPEFTEGGIVGQTKITIDYRFFISLQLVKMFLKSFI